MVGIANSLNISQQGTVYFDGLGVFTGIDADTSGFVLTSNGTGIAPSFQVGGGNPIQEASVVLTSAQVKALNATPIQIIAAQGAGKAIIVISAVGKMTYGGTNVFVAGAGQAIVLAYGTSPFDTVLTNTDVVSASTLYSYNNSSTVTGVSTATIENVALNAYNNVATEISGNAANDNTVTFVVQYYIVNI